MSCHVDRSRLFLVTDYRTWQERAQLFVQKFGGWDYFSYISWITSGKATYLRKLGKPETATITDQQKFTEFLKEWGCEEVDKPDEGVQAS